MRMVSNAGMRLWRCLIPAILIFACSSFPAYAQPVRNKIYAVTQPSGDQVILRITGDEYTSYIHDAYGSVIIQDGSGAYVYAREADEGLVSSGVVATNRGTVHRGFAQIDDVERRSVPPQNNLYRDNQAWVASNYDASLDKSEAASLRTAPIPLREQPLAQSANLHNLVVFIQFGGESAWVDTSLVNKYKGFFNTDKYSLKTIIERQSEGDCSVESVFPTIGDTPFYVYKDPYPRGYYLPYRFSNPMGYRSFEQRTEREHALIERATVSIASASNLPSSAELDQDADGYLDCLTFIAGGAAVQNSVLWGHMWGISESSTQIAGKKVQMYTFQMEGDSTTNVLVHEFMHLLGFPDLYRYHSSGDPVGSWDVMASPSRDKAQMANAEMRHRYGGWGSEIVEARVGQPIELVATSRFNERPDLPRAVRVALSSTEDVVLEYRSQGGDGFDAGVPVSGLIAYRVNKKVQDGNMGGPPDAYYVYREGVSDGRTAELQPLVSTTSNRAALSVELGRTAFGSLDDLEKSLYRDDAPLYTRSPFVIMGVGSSSGSTITFSVSAYRTVSFHSAGNISLPSKTVIQGALIDEPPAPSRDGYAFLGWCKDSALSKKWDFENDRVGSDDLTLYAAWNPPEPSNVTITSSPNLTVNYPSSSTIEGHLTTLDSKRFVGQVFLEHSVDGVLWKRVSTSYKTDSVGRFAIRIKPTSNKRYRVILLGNKMYQAATSAITIAKVRAYLSRPVVSDISPKKGKIVTVKGLLSPQHKRAPVKVYFQQKVNSQWVTRAVKSVVAGAYKSSSRYTLSYSFQRKGTWRIRAYHKDNSHIGAYSISRSIQVR